MSGFAKRYEKEGIGDLTHYEFFEKIKVKEKQKKEKVRFFFNYALVKPKEEETNAFFQSQIEINIEGTNERERFERARKSVGRFGKF